MDAHLVSAALRNSKLEDWQIVSILRTCWPAVLRSMTSAPSPTSAATLEDLGDKHAIAIDYVKWLFQHFPKQLRPDSNEYMARLAFEALVDYVAFAERLRAPTQDGTTRATPALDQLFEWAEDAIKLVSGVVPPLQDARAEVVDMRTEIRDAWDMCEAASERAGYTHCACMVDHKDDVCAVHSPAVAKLQAELTRLRTASAPSFNVDGVADKCFATLQRMGYSYEAANSMRIAVRKALEDASAPSRVEARPAIEDVVTALLRVTPYKSSYETGASGLVYRADVEQVMRALFAGRSK